MFLSANRDTSGNLADQKGCANKTRTASVSIAFSDLYKCFLHSIETRKKVYSVFFFFRKQLKANKEQRDYDKFSVFLSSLSINLLCECLMATLLTVYSVA